jgi:hypothetical protein
MQLSVLGTPTTRVAAVAAFGTTGKARKHETKDGAALGNGHRVVYHSMPTHRLCSHCFVHSPFLINEQMH